jgi:hypothetical protein
MVVASEVEYNKAMERIQCLSDLMKSTCHTGDWQQYATEFDELFGWIKRQDEIKAYLKAIQDDVHRRAVGNYN